MIKKNLKTLLIASVVTLLPMVAGLVLWNKLPEQMPFHWNAAGEVDDWTSKAFAVFGMPCLLAALEWICAFATGADPKKQNHSDKTMQLVLWIIPVISVLLHAFVYSSALGKGLEIEVTMPVFFGLLFAIIGNYLPKGKQNYTIGIRIPWTLNSEENWNRTHRFAGRLWVVGGLVIIATSFLGNFWIFVGITFLMAMVPIIYSYILHRKGV